MNFEFAERTCADLIDPDLFANFVMNLLEMRVQVGVNIQIKEHPKPVPSFKLDEVVAGRYKPPKPKSVVRHLLHPLLQTVTRAAHIVCSEKSEVHRPTKYLWTAFKKKAFDRMPLHKRPKSSLRTPGCHETSRTESNNLTCILRRGWLLFCNMLRPKSRLTRMTSD